MKITLIIICISIVLGACGGQPGGDPSSSVSSSSSLNLSGSSTSSTTSSNISSSPSSGYSAQFEESDSAFCGGGGVTEATNPGFSGVGYFNSNNSAGVAAVWRINVTDSAQNYIVNWRFANGGANPRPATLEVNGNAIETLNFAPTASWSDWEVQQQTLSLDNGDNEIRLVATTAEGLANIDVLEVVGPQLVEAGTCPVTANECMNIGINSSDVDIGSLLSCSGDPATCVLGGGVGNYKVSMAFDAQYSGNIEVFAESRRRMYFSSAQNGENSRCVSMLVNVRNPEGEPYSNDRGTNGLNLRITQGANALSALTYHAVNDPQTLFIIGDSTVADQPTQLDKAAGSRFTGWGQFIPIYFNEDIAVANYADSGEGTAAFRTDGGGLWNPINSRLKSGDWVMIQLGHNDKTTSASVYRSRITNMVTAIKQKGASPILISPMIRNTGDTLSRQHIWNDLNIRNELISIANSQNVPFIDLMELSNDWAANIGRSAAQAYFVGNDRTHSNELGAELFAQMIFNEIQNQNIGIQQYFRN